MNEKELYFKIYETKEQLGNLITEHWNLYSNMGTWYFWFNVAAILLPLIILFFALDKKRFFEVSFYGYSVHILWVYIDSYLTSNNYLNHPHSVSYLLPQAFTVTAVLFPVTFMLLYQYCIKNEKNFYIYSIIGSFIFAFGFGGISLAVELLRMHKGMNLFYIFLIDIAIVFTALGMTNLFKKIKNNKT